MTETNSQPLHAGVMVIVFVFMVFILIEISLCFHRVKTRSKILDITRAELRDASSKLEPTATPETIARVKTLLNLMHSLERDPYLTVASASYDPVSKSTIASISNKLVYHTAIGRTILESSLQFTTFITAALAYTMGGRINSYINYWISTTDLQAAGESTALLLVSIVCVLFVVVSSHFRLYIQSSMGSPGIIEPDKIEKEVIP